MQTHSFSGGPTTWAFDPLWTIFEDTVISSELHMIYCVIDAPDESEKESTESFLPLLTELLDQGANEVTVKLFLTSRTEGHIGLSRGRRCQGAYCRSHKPYKAFQP